MPSESRAAHLVFFASVGLLLCACPSPRPAPQAAGASSSSQGTSPPATAGEGASQESPLAGAERVSRTWIEALIAGDAGAAAEVSGLPFSVDAKQLVDTRAELIEVCTGMAVEASERGYELTSLTAVSDWRAFADGYLGSEEEDLIALRAVIDQPNTGEPLMMTIFVRPSPPAVVGFDD